MRLTYDFDGTVSLLTDGFELSDITIRRCGTKSGMPESIAASGAVPTLRWNCGQGWAYDLRNIDIRRIDIYDSRFDAVSIEADPRKRVENLELHDININRVADFRYGVNASCKRAWQRTLQRQHTRQRCDRASDGPYSRRVRFYVGTGGGLGNVADDGGEDVGCPFASLIYPDGK